MGREDSNELGIVTFHDASKMIYGCTFPRLEKKLSKYRIESNQIKSNQVGAEV